MGVLDQTMAVAGSSVVQNRSDEKRLGRQLLYLRAGADITLQTLAGSTAAGGTHVAITSGANVNFDRQRFVADRAEEHESLFAVTIPEERGSFRRFAELVGPRSVTEFNDRIPDTDEAVPISANTGRLSSAPVLRTPVR